MARSRMSRSHNDTCRSRRVHSMMRFTRCASPQQGKEARMDRRREHEENQRLERVLRGELIGEEAFCDEWGLTLAPSGDLFTYEQIRDQPIEHVWTVVDTGD